MNTLCIVFLGLFALSAARPSDIIDFEVDTDNLEHEHEQEGVAGKAVEGEYSWTAPNGEELYVKYIADHLGYRVVESNALPEAPEFDLDQPMRAPRTEVVEDEEDKDVPSRTVVVEDESDEDVPQFRAAEDESDEDENVFWYRVAEDSDED